MKIPYIQVGIENNIRNNYNKDCFSKKIKIFNTSTSYMFGLFVVLFPENGISSIKIIMPAPATIKASATLKAG